MKYDIKCSLPQRISTKYQFTSLLSLHENAIVLSLKRKNASSHKTQTSIQDISFEIIKIIPKAYFDEKLFETLQCLHHPLLLLPMELFSEAGFIYAAYPKFQSLSEYLHGEKISFSILIQWIRDMDSIVSSLHKNNILHGDIAPGNIYLNKEGHFLLGDFSSSRLLSPPHKNTIWNQGKKKTGSTFPCPVPAKGFTQDIYSFLTILLHLLKGFPLSDDKYNMLLSLQNNIENLISDINKEKISHLSFHKICKTILLQIEKEPLEKKLSHQDFVLSSKELDILNGNTRKINNNHLSFFSLPCMKYSITFFGVTICFLLFVFSLFFYIRSNQKSHNTVFSSKHIQEYNIPTTSSPIATTVDRPNKTVLDISSKRCQKIPIDVSTNPSVKIVFADNNLFKNISPFSIFSSLEELYLDNNHITNVTGITNLKKLSVLGLSNNQITNVSALGRLSSLTILDLSYQKHLSGLSSLERLKKLKYLILTGTNVTKKDIKYLQQKLPDCIILY